MSQNDPTIYDGLLFVSFAAVLAGIIFFVLALNDYGWAGP